MYKFKKRKIKYTLKGKTYWARIRLDGTISIKGKVFNSPSLAARHIAKRAANGWGCWQYMKAPGDWRYIDELRGKK